MALSGGSFAKEPSVRLISGLFSEGVPPSVYVLPLLLLDVRFVHDKTRTLRPMLLPTGWRKVQRLKEGIKHLPKINADTHSGTRAQLEFIHTSEGLK